MKLMNGELPTDEKDNNYSRLLDPGQKKLAEK